MKPSRFPFLLILILAACGEPSATRAPIADDVEITFTGHIGPIVHLNCSPCHRPQGGAPFSLLSYRDVAKRRKMVAYVTRIRYMPPWPADPEYRHFVGERVLDQEDIDLIQRWAKAGAPEGDGELIPPVFPTGSQLGTPDLVLRMDTPLVIRGDNRDRFYFVKLPYELERDTFIKTIEFIPGNRRYVHHMNANLVSYRDEAKEDVFVGGRVVESEITAVQVAYENLGIPNDDGSYPLLTRMVCNYLPGVIPPVYPRGVGGFYLKRKGALLLNDLHYGPSPNDTFDQSYFNIFFGSGPPERPVREVLLGTLGDGRMDKPLVVPADSIVDILLQALVPEDWSLLTINPHMHLLGSSFKAYAITPNNDSIPLIHIPEWNFRWQYFYTFERMLRLPRGTLIRVEARFDNTLDNPDNPYDPPRRISERDGSMRTTDEMLQFILSYVPYREGDEEIGLESTAKN